MTATPFSRPQELSWVVDGLRIAGLGWGPADGVPVLALHGWLDNAASFEMLAGQLPQCRIVAVDLTGHGHSAHRSPDATYQVWDDVPQIVHLLDLMQWERCVLLGHSRGSFVATIVAAIMADRVDALVTLDALLPPPVEDADFVTQLRAAIADRKRYAARSERIFQSRESYISRRLGYGTPEHITERISARALRARDDAFVWTGDARLFGKSPVKLNRHQCDAILRALAMPVLWMSFNHGLAHQPWMLELAERAEALVGDLTTVRLDGHHHCHMEEQQAAAIADHIAAFLEPSNQSS